MRSFSLLVRRLTHGTLALSLAGALLTTTEAHAREREERAAADAAPAPVEERGPREEGAPAATPDAEIARNDDMANLDARLAFLESRIAAQRTHAEIWWGGWSLFYTVGLHYQIGQAAAADDPAQRADLVISAVKAAGGLARYLAQPHGGIRGLPPAPASLSVADKRRRVRHAEGVLEHNADNTDAFGPWYAHVLNVGINFTGAVIVGAGFDDWTTGLISAGIGTGVGEIAILTGPWEADDDVEEYAARFGSSDSALAPPERKASDTAVSLSLQPTAGGLQLVGRM